MVCTVYGVKVAYGQYDGQSDTPPDVTFDSSKGYYTGFRLLVEDGTSWVCADAAIGAAVWNLDAAKDAEITAACRALTGRLIAYCDDTFPAHSGRMSSSGIAFADAGSITDDNSRFGVFYVGDTLLIAESLRNDGYYDATSVAAGAMTLSPEFPLTGEQEGTVYLYASLFPPALSQIASKMVAYDMWSRQNSGLDSESIGSYSYSKTILSIEGVGYPADVVAGLMSFKRPRVR